MVFIIYSVTVITTSYWLCYYEETPLVEDCFLSYFNLTSNLMDNNYVPNTLKKKQF